MTNGEPAAPDEGEHAPVLSGKILITGPSGSGKTLACAQALAQYVQTNGTQGVAVLEFGPNHTRPDGRVLGRRLDHFMPIPEGVLHFVVPTRAPRAATTDPEDAIRIAKENAEACRKVLMLLPDQIPALFVNDASMAFHVPGADPNLLVQRLNGATIAVVTSLDPVGFEPEHPITKQEKSVLDILARNVDHVVTTAPPAPQGDIARLEAEAASRGEDTQPGGAPGDE